MQPKVSIIVPVYNVEKYLSTCLDSLINQTLQDIEIICVNDATPDGCQMILEEYAAKDKRISIYQHEHNRGLSAARNTGLEQAKGEYVYFMDSDDILELNAMEVCYQIAKGQNVDIVTFDAQTFDDEGYQGLQGFDYNRSAMLKSFLEKPISTMTLFETLLDTGTYRSSVCLLFIKRSILSSSKLVFEEGLLHEDELFTPQLFVAAERVVYIPHQFFHRRIRSGSIMTTRSSKRVEHSLRIVYTLQHLQAPSLKWRYLLNVRAWQICRYLNQQYGDYLSQVNPSMYSVVNNRNRLIQKISALYNRLWK